MMPTFPKRYADAVAKLRVPAGFVLVLVFAWFSRPRPSLVLGLPLGLLGLFLRAWAQAVWQRTSSLPPAARTPTRATRSTSAPCW